MAREGGSQAQPFTGQLAHCAGKQTREWRHLHRPPPHTWLQNIHVASELSLVFRIVACIQNCHPKTCVCSSTCAQDLCWWCRVIAAPGSWSHTTRQAAGVHGTQGDEWDSALNVCFRYNNAVDTVQLVPSTRMARSELKLSHWYCK